MVSRKLKVRAAIAAALCGIRAQKRSNRRWWRRPGLQRREIIGEFFGLVPHLRDHDTEMYRMYMRMSPERFQHLLSFVSPRLSRPNAKRESVPADEKLMMTLCFLASGCSQRDLSFRFGRGFSTVSKIVFECANVIYQELASKYLKFPSSEQEWLDVAAGFWEKWHFPNCLGAIDGKHFKIQCPANSGSRYFNYKHQFSCLVLAMCDSSYKFLYAEVGSTGREGDAGIFSRSALCAGLDSKSLNVPEPAKVAGTHFSTPFAIVGDEAFPLKTYLMRPFPGRGGRTLLDYKTRVYNYRLSRARRTIENAFGILVSRWRLFLRPVAAKVEHVESFIRCAFVLHNYLRIEDDKGIESAASMYASSNYIDQELSDGRILHGAWRSAVSGSSGVSAVGPLGSNHSSATAREQQTVLREFFVSPQGALPWQCSMVQS